MRNCGVGTWKSKHDTSLMNLIELQIRLAFQFPEISHLKEQTEEKKLPK
jgi:hypothetical protein